MHKWFPSRMRSLSKLEYRAALLAALLAVTLVFGAFSFAPEAHAASLIPASSSGVQQAGQVSQLAASYPEKGWRFSKTSHNPDGTNTAGNIIFYNRSVQIGGHVNVGAADCAAVVFLVEDASGHRLSSAARPGTGRYSCGVQDGRFSFGFRLPANVAGGASKVVVQLWASSCKCVVGHQDVKR